MNERKNEWMKERKKERKKGMSSWVYAELHQVRDVLVNKSYKYTLTHGFEVNKNFSAELIKLPVLLYRHPVLQMLCLQCYFEVT
jgi:hypothetical protein